MKHLRPIMVFAALAALAACKPQDPAPLPPQVGTSQPPPAAAQPPATAASPTDSSAAAPTAAATSSAADPATAGATAVDGAAIYRQTCATCHATGLAGAPKPGDAADWAPRIAQGEAVLLQHAIEGFTGKKGVMPPKGGFMHLNEEQIRAVIAHMTAQ